MSHSSVCHILHYALYFLCRGSWLLVCFSCLCPVLARASLFFLLMSCSGLCPVLAYVLFWLMSCSGLCRPSLSLSSFESYGQSLKFKSIVKRKRIKFKSIVKRKRIKFKSIVKRKGIKFKSVIHLFLLFWSYLCRQEKSKLTSSPVLCCFLLTCWYRKNVGNGSRKPLGCRTEGVKFITGRNNFRTRIWNLF